MKMNKGGVTARLHQGPYVDAITMRSRRYLSGVCPAVRDPKLLVKRLGFAALY